MQFRVSAETPLEVDSLQERYADEQFPVHGRNDGGTFPGNASECAPVEAGDRSHRARAWWPVDADGAEDNHAVAAPTARPRAVVALRALDNCIRLPKDRPSSCPPRPQALPLPGVFCSWEEIRLSTASDAVAC
jgi:hypothetical protein